MMVGFLKSWKMSGLTTDGAKLSEPIHELGFCLANEAFFEITLDPEERARIVSIGQFWLEMKRPFDAYVDTGNKIFHDDTVKFLVMVAAVLQGMEGGDWQWQKVRHLSQGLYGSLMDERDSFIFINLPRIQAIGKDIQDLIRSSIK
jgi:hypothetical protein